MKIYRGLGLFKYVLLASILSSCGGGGGGGETTTNNINTVVETPVIEEIINPVTISGVAIKGTIKNGVVNIYGVTGGIQDTRLLTSTITDLDGNYETEISSNSGPVVIEVVAGADTTMTCDVLSGCGNYEFGDDVPMTDSNFNLNVIIPEATANTRANISILSTMAAEQAKSEGITALNVDAANADVALLFGTFANLTSIEFVDVTSATELSLVDLDAQRISLISAAILSEGLESGLDIVESIDSFIGAYNDNDGKLQVVETIDTSNITLEDIFVEVENILSTYEGFSDLETRVSQDLSVSRQYPSGALISSFDSDEPIIPTVLGSNQVVFESPDLYAGACEQPRTGIDPFTGASFIDYQGSTFLENLWLRSWTNDLYLWYDEVLYQDPKAFINETTGSLDYFETLKTLATTPSGALRDQFHFAVDSEIWQQFSQSGVEAGYGAKYFIIDDLPPQQIIISYVEPGSPAANAGFVRGTVIKEITPYIVSHTDINILANALFPAFAGETYSFTVRHPGASNDVAVDLTSENVTATPVSNTTVIPTGTGDVGYILFNEHIATSEQQLFDAFTTLEAANVSDLVLDLRYNGGGLLAIAAQTAYMIAGASATAGKVFERTTFNDKHPVIDPVTGEVIQAMPFIDEGIGFSLVPGQALPSLELQRVFILTTPETCSASESIINGLRGINIEVVIVGAKTCGKPYGFYPQDNCGTTFFSIQFSGQNDISFGDYSDGFSPQNWPVTSQGVPVNGCAVADDFGNALGDPAEALLAAALGYRNTNTCPAVSTWLQTSSAPTLSSSFSRNKSTGPSIYQQQSFMRQNRILSMPK